MSVATAQQLPTVAVVCPSAEICNAKVAQCEHCGTEFTYQRERRARFCGGACRVAWHRKSARPIVPGKERCTLAGLAAWNRFERHEYRKKKRSGISMAFDARGYGGKIRGSVGLERPTGFAAQHGMEAEL